MGQWNHSIFQRATKPLWMAMSVQCLGSTGAGRINTTRRKENLPMGEHLEGRYANYFEIGFTALEFLFDFGQFDEDSGAAIRHTRIITNPASAKTFLKMLKEVVTEYEASVEKADGTEP